jgi:hypothetical protein
MERSVVSTFERNCQGARPMQPLLICLLLYLWLCPGHPQVLRLQCERANLELASVRDDLARRIAAATEGADAVLNTAAGELLIRTG